MSRQLDSKALAEPVARGEVALTWISRRAIELLSAELKQKRGGGKVEPTTVALRYELIRRDSDTAPTLAKRSGEQRRPGRVSGIDPMFFSGPSG